MSSVIDFHTHIIPHMDDGSRSVSMSIQMLSAMKDQGVDVSVATPHYYARKESVDSFLNRRNDALAHLYEKAESLPLPLKIGAEVAFYFGIEDDVNIEKLCIEGTRTLLLEMPFSPWSDYEINAVSELSSARGLDVVIAHYERFEGFQKGNRKYEELLTLPVKIQINAESIIPLFGGRKWIKYFESGKADVLGSDCHNTDKRPPNLGQARRILQKKCGSAVLSDIDKEMSILAGCL